MGTFSITQTRANINLFLVPNAVGCNTELTPIGATNNWECIDDDRNAPDDNSTYVKNSSPTLKYDLYVLPNHTTEIGTINYVQVFARAESHLYSQAEDGIYKILITDNSCVDIYKSDDIDLTADSYGTFSKVWTTNPRTASAWTWNDVDNIQAGLECNSPLLSDAPKTLTIRPNGVGDLTELKPVPTYEANWENVDEISKDNFTTYNYSWGETGDDDLYTLTNHTTETGTITKVVTFAWIYADDQQDPLAYTEIKIGGVRYFGDMIIEHPNGVWILLATEYTVNPFTSSAWTWTDIDNLQAGVHLETPVSGANKCTQVYVVVHYLEDTYPEIRTTQCYAKVNYVPPDVECTLNKPENISVDHNRNIKMLNFWNGTREVYDLSRNSKTMVLTGSEHQSGTCNKSCPCDHIACMRAMGKDGSTITISGLRSLFNADFKIRSFGWKHISKKPEVYDWILELEYAD